MLPSGARAGSPALDRRIELSARESYVFKTYLKSDAIGVEAKDGMVTLTGSVGADSAKALARETVAGLPDVKGVENNLQVTGAPTPSSDAWLSDKLKITLLFHRSVRAGKTEVEVKEGVVTLRGRAESQAQKELAAEYARDIEGVKEVINEMTVAPQPEGGLRTAGEKIDDASITAQVKLALLLHRSTSAVATAVRTRRGTVTLEGKAANAAERDLVTRLVNDINGVRKVKNRMSLE
jgi:osmotically-inducible protein OsmY